MTRDEFEHLLLLYGSQFERWPQDAAHAAQNLMRNDPHAQALLAEARALDGVIAEAAGPDAVGSALTGRILARVDTARTGGSISAAVRWWRLAGAGAAVAASIAGFTLGFFDGASLEAANDVLSMTIGGADMGVWSLL